MGFIRPSRKGLKFFRQLEFYDAERLTVLFETKPEVVRRLLPPPLEPGMLPIGAAFAARYPKTNFGLTYMESGLGIQARFKGEEGLYWLGMPVDNDMAMIGGREGCGFPKKIGSVSLKRQGQQVNGWTERHGVRLMEINAKMTGKFNDKRVQDFIAAKLQAPEQMTSFNFKHFPAPGGNGFDYNPRLVKSVANKLPKQVDFGEGELVLRSSEDDPWDEVEVVRVIGAIYDVVDLTVMPGTVLAEVDPAEFAPYSALKVDAGFAQ